MKLSRRGYGSSFNCLTIEEVKDQKILTKEAITEHGKMRMKNEIAWYKWVLANKENKENKEDKENKENKGINIPRIINLNESRIQMEWLDDYTPLWKCYRSDMLSIVKEELSSLHQKAFIDVSFDKAKEDLYSEIVVKNKQRYESIKELLKPYEKIKKVNGTNINTLENYIEKIYIMCLEKINKKDKIKYVPIHGDCQFNNVLIKDKHIVFIDPRGYWGSSSVFGLEEYDWAKIKFALTGYDYFDSMDVKELIINNDEIKIDLPFLEQNIFNDDIESLLCGAIWLGNAHCFIAEPMKLITSYFYALFLCEKILGIKDAC